MRCKLKQKVLPKGKFFERYCIINQENHLDTCSAILKYSVPQQQNRNCPKAFIVDFILVRLFTYNYDRFGF